MKNTGLALRYHQRVSHSLAGMCSKRAEERATEWYSFLILLLANSCHNAGFHLVVRVDYLRYSMLVSDA